MMYVVDEHRSGVLENLAVHLKDDSLSTFVPAFKLGDGSKYQRPAKHIRRYQSTATIKDLCNRFGIVNDRTTLMSFSLAPRYAECRISN